MKSWVLGAAWLVGWSGGGSAARAESATSHLTIVVKAVHRLEVTDGGPLVLEALPGQSQLGPAQDDTARLQFTHNLQAPQQITAEVRPGDAPDPATNDLLLRVSVQDGTGPQTLYNEGGATGPQEVLSQLSAGAVTPRRITYEAAGTAPGTPVDQETLLTFTITFTSLDE